MTSKALRISVITPSLNQREFIERTIQSVLDQGYPNLEYIIVDGGSTDGSVEIIKRYEKHLAYWVSEKDRGQAHAINKGLRRATGDIVAYLNSDDYYESNTFETVARYFSVEPAHQWLIGACRYVTNDGHSVQEFAAAKPAPGDRVLWILREHWGHPQPSTFWRYSVFERCGFFREDMDYVFDSEHGIRAVFAGMLPLVVPELLATRILHDGCKTVRSPESFTREKERFVDLYAPRLAAHERRRLHEIRLRRTLQEVHRHPSSASLWKLAEVGGWDLGLTYRIVVDTAKSRLLKMAVDE